MKSFLVKVVLVNIFICLLNIQNIFGEIPTSSDKIPLYNGCKLIAEENAPSGGGLLSGTIREYEVSSPIEDVVSFYENILEIKKRFEDPEDQNNLKPGQFVNPTIQVYFHDESTFIDGDFGEGGVSKRGWIKKALDKRKKDKEGLWIESANSQWYYRDTDNSMVELQITVEDRSIDEENEEYQLKTGIIIRVIRYKYDF